MKKILIISIFLIIFIHVAALENYDLTATYLSDNEWRISFTLKENSVITLEITGLDGELVKTLVKAIELDPGSHSYIWAGKNEQGQIVEGTHARLVHGKRVFKVLLLKWLANREKIVIFKLPKINLYQYIIKSKYKSY